MQSTAYEVQPGVTTIQPNLAGSDADKHSKHTASEEGRQDHLDSQQPRSAGVERIKLVSQSLTPALRVFLFVGIFLIAYACVSTSCNSAFDLADGLLFSLKVRSRFIGPSYLPGTYRLLLLCIAVKARRLGLKVCSPFRLRRPLLVRRVSQHLRYVQSAPADLPPPSLTFQTLRTRYSRPSTSSNPSSPPSLR